MSRDAQAERLRPTTIVRKASNSKKNNILEHARKDCDNTSWWILREFGSIALVVFAFVLLIVRRIAARKQPVIAILFHQSVNLADRGGPAT